MAETGTGVRDHLLLLGRFLRHPRTVGAVAPSSRILVRQMLKDLHPHPGVRVVELGPGTGAVTRGIVARLPPTGRCLAIEVEPAFVEQIQRDFPTVECVSASAEDLEALVAARHFAPVDHVVSGLPFATLPVQTSARVLDGIARTLRPGGTFTTFQYVYSYFMPPAKTFRRETSARLGMPARKRLVIRNIPPAWVLSWKKT